MPLNFLIDQTAAINLLEIDSRGARWGKDAKLDMVILE